MSLHETWRTIKYWESIGGTLILEYPAIKGNSKSGKRLIDGIIIKNKEKQLYKYKCIPVENEEIIVIQTKKDRLGMYLMGQSFFSKEIMKRYNPRSIEVVAICGKNDDELEKICRKYDIKVIVIEEK